MWEDEWGRGIIQKVWICVCHNVHVHVLRNLCGGVCWRGEELYKWGTVLASLDWERLIWRGQGDKRATANSKSDQVMEKGGVEERERGGGVHEYLGNSNRKSRQSNPDIQSNSCEAWTSVALSCLAVKAQGQHGQTLEVTSHLTKLAL